MLYSFSQTRSNRFFDFFELLNKGKLKNTASNTRPEIRQLSMKNWSVLEKSGS